MNKLTLAEVARRIFKSGHADKKEYANALNFYRRASAEAQKTIEELGKQYQ